MMAIVQLEIAAERGQFPSAVRQNSAGAGCAAGKKPEGARTQLKELVAEFPENPLFASELAKLHVPGQGKVCRIEHRHLRVT